MICAVGRQPEAERQQDGVSGEQRDDLAPRQAQVQRGGKSTQHHGWSDLAADEIPHDDRLAAQIEAGGGDIMQPSGSADVNDELRLVPQRV